MALSAELTAVSLGPIRWAPGDPGRLLKVSSEAMQNFVPLSLTSPQIHESALRAKNRRQVERRRLAAQRQRAHSADAERGRGPRPPSAESPWVTEYMRCYSARA